MAKLDISMTNPSSPLTIGPSTPSNQPSPTASPPRLINSSPTIGLRPLQVLCIGDPHYKVSNVRETREFETSLFTWLQQGERPDLIVCMGDVLDRHETIHVSPLERATAFLRRLTEFAPTYVLIGNHDRPNNSTFLTDEHPFNALKYWQVDQQHHPITVVDTTIKREHHGHQLIFVPYVPPGRFTEALSHLRTAMCPWGTSLEWIEEHLKDVSALFTHQEFYGSVMGGTMKSSAGDKWSPMGPPIFNGHIHDYGQPQPNIYNIGTPFQHAFGDREDKTISWVTLINPKEHTHRRIDLGLTKKRIVELTCAEVTNFVPDPQFQTKLVIIGTSAELKQIAKLYHVKQLADRGIKVVYKDSGETAAQNQRLTSELSDSGRGDTTTFNQLRSQGNVSYLQRLYQGVAHDEPLQQLFRSIFGQPNVPSSPHVKRSPNKLTLRIQS